MAAFRVAVIGGDGIGPEVIDQAIRVVDAALRHDEARLEWQRLPWNTAYYKQHGRMMPEDGWEILKRHDAILFGAIGSPDVPDHVTIHAMLLPMRRKFDQYVNLRPAYLFDVVPCPLRDKAPGRVPDLADLVHEPGLDEPGVVAYGQRPGRGHRPHVHAQLARGHAQRHVRRQGNRLRRRRRRREQAAGEEAHCSRQE